MTTGKNFINYYFKPRTRYSVNLCRQYSFGNPYDDRVFNRKWNDVKLRWVLHKKNDLTKMIHRSVKLRIRDESNSIVVFSGDPGTGKSEGAQKFSLWWLAAARYYLNLKSKFHLAFSTPEFDDKLSILGKGDAIIRDESPQIQGEGAYNLVAQLNNITKMVRAKQMCFIFVSPEVIKSKVVNYYFESAGKDKKTRTTRFIVYDGQLKPQGYVILPLHTNETFRKAYKKKKNENIDEVLEYGGLVTYLGRGKQLIEDANNLVEFTRSFMPDIKKWSQTTLNPLLVIYNTMQKDVDKTKLIKGDTNYVKKVIALAYLLSQRKSLLEKGSKESEDDGEMFEEMERLSIISYDVDMTFPRFVYNNLRIKSEKQALIGMCISRGESNRDIYNDFGKKTDEDEGVTMREIITIGKYLRSFAKSDVGIPYLAERYVALHHYKIPVKDIDEACKGAELDEDGNPYPDIYYEPLNVLASVKWRFNKTKTFTFSQEKDFAPERNKALALGRNYDMVFMNPTWDDDIRVINIDPMKDPDEIKINLKEVKKLKM